MFDFINLPERALKPRKAGLTIVIDNGCPTHFFSDIIQSHGHLIDFIKLGWGTAYITKDIRKKLSVVKEFGIDVFLGGTFFELALNQNKITDYIKYNKMLGLSFIEISNGTITLSNSNKARWITKLSSEFQVISEVGYKDTQRSLELSPSKWIQYIKEDLEAGAYKVITEARESGASGICRENGELRFGLIEEIINADIDLNLLVFEAPNKSLQTYFIKRIGFDVNLANISLTDIIGLETLRLGLRADTLSVFTKEVCCETVE